MQWLGYELRRPQAELQTPTLRLCPPGHPSKPPQRELSTSMLHREGQHFPASPEEKYIRDASYRGDGELCQQRQKQHLGNAA